MKNILSLSGGKDSTAAALHLVELGIEHERIFLDVGWDSSLLYEHLDYLEGLLGPITRIQPALPVLPADVMPEVEAVEALVGSSPSAFVRWAVYKKIFPSRVKRWCTQKLKIQPFLQYCDSQDDDVLNILGIRAAESQSRSRMVEREPMPGVPGVEIWRPILHWTDTDVIQIHHRHGVRPCALYLHGLSRVGCWPCVMCSKEELAHVARDARRVEAIRRLEDLLGRLVDRQMAMFWMRPPGGKASYMPYPIDSVLEWAATERGGRQVVLDTGWGQEAGCVRWGMCEVETM